MPVPRGCCWRLLDLCVEPASAAERRRCFWHRAAENLVERRARFQANNRLAPSAWAALSSFVYVHSERARRAHAPLHSWQGSGLAPCALPATPPQSSGANPAPYPPASPALPPRPPYKAGLRQGSSSDSVRLWPMPVKPGAAPSPLRMRERSARAALPLSSALPNSWPACSPVPK